MSRTVTKAEAKWLDDFQKLMDKCPSKNLSSFTIGDREIVIFDGKKEREVDDMMDSGAASDFCVGVRMLDAEIERIQMPFVVNSTAG